MGWDAIKCKNVIKVKVAQTAGSFWLQGQTPHDMCPPRPSWKSSAMLYLCLTFSQCRHGDLKQLHVNRSQPLRPTEHHKPIFPLA